MRDNKNDRKIIKFFYDILNIYFLMDDRRVHRQSKLNNALCRGEKLSEKSL